MPFVLGVIAALAAVWFFVFRARNAANVATDLLDVANDVRLAARRFGFRRQADVHPVDSVEDARVAAAALGAAFIELDDLPTKDQRDRLQVELAREFGVSGAEAGEMVILGRWLIGQCGGAEPAVARLARRLYRISGNAMLEPVLRVVQGSVTASSSGLSDRQRAALEDLRVALRIR